jgi:hypothetical protein
MRQHMALFPIALLAACGGDAAAGALATRADSAGIEIVSSTEPSWRNDGGWRIEPEFVQIGHREDDDPRYDLLRVSSGRILPDGNILVVVGGHFQLRIYDPAGEWVRSIGRQGDGPGEMRFPSSLNTAGDTIYLGDFQLSRLSAFTTAGEFLTSWPFPAMDPGGRVPPSRRLADGRWLGSGSVRFTAGQAASGIDRTPTTWYRIAADLSRVEDTVAVLPGTERLVITSTSADGRIVGMQVTAPSVARSSAMTTGPDYFVAGENDVPEARFYTTEGALRTIIRWAAPVVPVDEALLAAIMREELLRVEGNEQATQSVETRFQTPPATAVVPYFSGLHLDVEENLWVREYATLSSDSVRFRVFHRDGQFLGHLALPPNHTILDITTDRILTVWRDDDDLEYLRVYRVER